jgi:hypothetical protein
MNRKALMNFPGKALVCLPLHQPSRIHRGGEKRFGDYNVCGKVLTLQHARHMRPGEFQEMFERGKERKKKDLDKGKVHVKQESRNEMTFQPRDMLTKTEKYPVLNNSSSEHGRRLNEF